MHFVLTTHQVLRGRVWLAAPAWHVAPLALGLCLNVSLPFLPGGAAGTRAVSRAASRSVDGFRLPSLPRVTHWGKA